MATSSTPDLTQYIGRKGAIPMKIQPPSGTIPTVVAPAATAATTTTPWGFATSTQADALIACVVALEGAVRNLGASVSA